MLLLAAALIVATMTMMSAGPASADALSDSQLQHKIQVIKHRPGPLTNQERQHIQNLRERIRDNDDDN